MRHTRRYAGSDRRSVALQSARRCASFFGTQTYEPERPADEGKATKHGIKLVWLAPVPDVERAKAFYADQWVSSHRSATTPLGATTYGSCTPPGGFGMLELRARGTGVVEQRASVSVAGPALVVERRSRGAAANSSGARASCERAFQEFLGSPSLLPPIPAPDSAPLVHPAAPPSLTKRPTDGRRNQKCVFLGDGFAAPRNWAANSEVVRFSTHVQHVLPVVVTTMTIVGPVSVATPPPKRGEVRGHQPEREAGWKLVEFDTTHDSTSGDASRRGHRREGLLRLGVDRGYVGSDVLGDTTALRILVVPSRALATIALHPKSLAPTHACTHRSGCRCRRLVRERWIVPGREVGRTTNAASGADGTTAARPSHLLLSTTRRQSTSASAVLSTDDPFL